MVSPCPVSLGWHPITLPKPTPVWRSLSKMMSLIAHFSVLLEKEHWLSKMKEQTLNIGVQNMLEIDCTSLQSMFWNLPIFTRGIIRTSNIKWFDIYSATFIFKMLQVTFFMAKLLEIGNKFQTFHSFHGNACPYGFSTNPCVCSKSHPVSGMGTLHTDFWVFCKVCLRKVAMTSDMSSTCLLSSC